MIYSTLLAVTTSVLGHDIQGPAHIMTCITTLLGHLFNPFLDPFSDPFYDPFRASLGYIWTKQGSQKGPLFRPKQGPLLDPVLNQAQVLLYILYSNTYTHGYRTSWTHRTTQGTDRSLYLQDTGYCLFIKLDIVYAAGHSSWDRLRYWNRGTAGHSLWGSGMGTVLYGLKDTVGYAYSLLIEQCVWVCGDIRLW